MAKKKPKAELLLFEGARVPYAENEYYEYCLIFFSKEHELYNVWNEQIKFTEPNNLQAVARPEMSAIRVSTLIKQQYVKRYSSYVDLTPYIEKGYDFAYCLTDKNKDLWALKQYSEAYLKDIDEQKYIIEGRDD